MLISVFFEDSRTSGNVPDSGFSYTHDSISGLLCFEGRSGKTRRLERKKAAILWFFWILSKVLLHLKNTRQYGIHLTGNNVINRFLRSFN